MSIINDFDQTILFFIKSFSGSFLDYIMVFITSLGDGLLIWILIALVLIFNKKTRNIGYMVILVLLLNTLVVDGIIKVLIHRPRPYIDFPEVKILVRVLNSYSFPSGHAASSFAAAYILSKNFKKYAAWFFGLAILISFSRIYLFVHYPSDVIAGIIIGLLCGKFVYYLFNKCYKKDDIKKSFRCTDI